jgi:hypothetical protein
MTTKLSATIKRLHLREFALIALAGLVLSGCGPRVERGRIFGKITYQGQPLTEGLILFSDAAHGVNMTADLKPDGTYEITTAEGKGLPLGTYKVCVCPPLVNPTMGPGAPPKPKEYPNIPKKYRRYETSGLTLTVQQGKNPFDVEMKP